MITTKKRRTRPAEEIYVVYSQPLSILNKRVDRTVKSHWEHFGITI